LICGGIGWFLQHSGGAIPSLMPQLRESVWFRLVFSGETGHGVVLREWGVGMSGVARGFCRFPQVSGGVRSGGAAWSAEEGERGATGPGCEG
jgi:hypothetical protein